ncbi:MAG: hypothetical protein AAFZ65_17860, partial [Planctomycetota bacterium]
MQPGLASAQGEILLASGDVLPDGTTVFGIRDLAIAEGGHWAAAARIAEAEELLSVVVDGLVLVDGGQPLPGDPQ